MKAASRVFLIIGLLASLVMLLIGLIAVVTTASNPNIYDDTGITPFLLIYGGYALITSIGSLVAISGSSKKAINIWAIFYIPVVFLASIFMWSIDERDL